MTAFGRLWRRAPLWRVSLVTSVVCTGLAAMFPPALPDLSALRARLSHGDGPHAQFHPQRPPPAAADSGMLHVLPPGGPVRTGQIPFAGRQLPLPAGGWEELAIGRSQDQERRQVMMLDRVVGNHLTGLILAAAPGVMSGATGMVGVPPPCADPNRLAGGMVPAQPGDSPLTHECWSAAPIDMQAATGRGGDEMMQRGLGRLGDQHVAVPDHMMAVSFVRSTDTGWTMVTVLLPDKGGPVTHLRDWANRFQSVLHKGYDGTLTAADLTHPAVQDPS